MTRIEEDNARAEIDGYAAIFDEADQTGDVIRRGAFSRNNKKLIHTDGFRGTMLYQHMADQPVGKWEECHEDRNGLYVRGSLFLDTEVGQYTYHLLRGGAIDGLSIGFKPNRVRKQREGKRELLSISLWEISIVTFPMASRARIARVGMPGERLPRNLFPTS